MTVVVVVTVMLAAVMTMTRCLVSSVCKLACHFSVETVKPAVSVFTEAGKPEDGTQFHNEAAQ